MSFAELAGGIVGAVMNGDKVLDPLFEIAWQGDIGFDHVGEIGVAATVRNFKGVQDVGFGR